MKCYHGTPIGGSRQDVARFLVARQALVPFLRRDDMGAVAEFCRSFIFDNSAYSAFMRGAEVDFDAYIKWVEEWHRHPGFDWGLIPDVIDGTETDNDALVRGWPRRFPGVPVWHMHESLARLERLAASWPRVCIGSSGEFASVGTAAWWGQMARAMRVVCNDDGEPLCKLHGLRMLNPEIFTRLPLSSADSTNIGRNIGIDQAWRGTYSPPTKEARAQVMRARIDSQNAPARWAFTVPEEPAPAQGALW